MSKLKLALGVIRLPFLVLAPACVFLGIACARRTSGEINLPQAYLAMLGAVLAHVSVNALNEYSDFKSGLDLKTRRTPFSGGSGALAASPEFAGAALAIGLVSLAGTAAIGAYFVVERGSGILPLGILGILTIAAYTPWFSRNPILCLIAPGLGFGTLMVVGTSFALTGRYTGIAFLASFIPFFLVSDLLLLNQFPDAAADRTVGRKHLVIVAGLRIGSLVYVAQLVGAYLVILAGVFLEIFPLASLLGMATLPLAVAAGVAAFRHGADVPKLIPAMGMNVLVNLLTPVLVAVGLWIG